MMLEPEQEEVKDAEIKKIIQIKVEHCNKSQTERELAFMCINTNPKLPVLRYLSP